MAEEKREPMTISEAGRKGGETTLREHGPEFYSKIGQKGGQNSWTANPEGAKVPELNDEDRRRYDEIRAKLDRGEELTTEEAGFLGGVKRVQQASGEK